MALIANRAVRTTMMVTVMKMKKMVSFIFVLIQIAYSESR